MTKIVSPISRTSDGPYINSSRTVTKTRGRRRVVKTFTSTDAPSLGAAGYSPAKLAKQVFYDGKLKKTKFKSLGISRSLRLR